MMYLRIQNRSRLSPIDYADYMRRARWEAHHTARRKGKSRKLPGCTINRELSPSGPYRPPTNLWSNTCRHRTGGDPLPPQSPNDPLTQRLYNWGPHKAAWTTELTYCPPKRSTITSVCTTTILSHHKHNNCVLSTWGPINVLFKKKIPTVSLEFLWPWSWLSL